MSRIGDGDGGPSGAGGAGAEPWPEEATSRVRSLRSAITEDTEGDWVDTDVAPLLPDLLTRLDAVSRPEPTSELDAPSPPDEVTPPSPADQMYLLREVERKLEARVAEADGEAAEAISEMAETLRRYRALREEVVVRSDL